MLQGSDENAADDVDRHDHQPGDGVAADELRSTVHRAEEGRFLFELLAALARLFLVDQAR